MRRTLLSTASLLVAASAAVAARGAGAGAGAPKLAYTEPAWSHSGGLMAVVGRSSGGRRSLYVMSASGDRIRLLHPGGLVQSPTWSRDDRRIAFADRDGIFIINAGGSGLRQIQMNGYSPSWSPDGREIAYAWGDETSGARIYVVRPDGSGQRIAAAPDESHSYSHPSWSPDGRRIAFYVGQAPDANGPRPFLGVVRASGGRTGYLLRDRDPIQPSWSPTGGRIAFSESLRRIALFDLKRHRITPLRLGQSPSWSPNGRRIAFSRAGAIFVMRSNGSRLRRLTP